MMVCRPPIAVLRPFVALIWATDGADRSPLAAKRELVLPSGAMHIVFRLGNTPLRLFAGPDDCTGYLAGTSIVGGVRAVPYCKDISLSVPTVGMMLCPGAMELLARTPARVLAGAHTKLEDVWPRADLAELRERLESAATCEARLLVMEAFLGLRLPPVRGIHPLVAHALARFGAGTGVADVVVESGYSHRHFAKTFEEAIGLTPKTYCRVMRFSRVLDRVKGEPGASWAHIAAAEGYADQAHMSREFLEFAGVTPGRYRRIAPAAPRHVPI